MAISNPTLLDTQTLRTAIQLNSASISPSANALLVIVHTVLASKGSGWRYIFRVVTYVRRGL